MIDYKDWMSFIHKVMPVPGKRIKARVMAVKGLHCYIEVEQKGKATTLFHGELLNTANIWPLVPKEKKKDGNDS